MEFNEFFVRGMALLGAGIAMIAGVGQGIGKGRRGDRPQSQCRRQGAQRAGAGRRAGGDDRHLRAGHLHPADLSEGVGHARL